jgi:hypothetical protein
MINTEIREYTVVLKLYLDISPSASCRSSLKNYLASKAEMNKYNIMRKPKFIMA